MGNYSLEEFLDWDPPIRGRISTNAAIGKTTWFQVGGNADILFRPKDTKDLANFLNNCPRDIGVTVIGAGSNILVRDGGISGVTIRLRDGFRNVSFEKHNDEEVIVTCGAGALDVIVSRKAAAEGVGGLEFLSGVPGSIGGALRMNAGAYGKEMKDVVVWATALDGQGSEHKLSNNDISFNYRHCNIPNDWIFTSAALRANILDKSAIQSSIERIANQRSDTQPIRARTSGSTFKNPNGHKAWELIDRAGCRGLRLGGAKVSEKHCNFLVNAENATAADLENLGEEIRRRVKDSCGIILEWEIERVGQHNSSAHGSTKI